MNEKPLKTVVVKGTKPGTKYVVQIFETFETCTWNYRHKKGTVGLRIYQCGDHWHLTKKIFLQSNEQ